MKRILAYSLACLLSLSLLCTPASAAEIQNGTKHNTDTSNSYHIGYLNAFDVRYLHPNELLTRTEMAYMMYRLLDPNQLPDTLINYQPFTDLPFASDNHCIASLSVIGLLRGYEDGSFRPDNPISRAHKSPSSHFPFSALPISLKSLRVPLRFPTYLKRTGLPLPSPLELLPVGCPDIPTGPSVLTRTSHA